MTCFDDFRASDNWRVLKELEKAAEVYWKAKDRLPPRVCEITCSPSFLFPLSIHPQEVKFPNLIM